MDAGHTTTWEDMSDYPPVDRFFDVDDDRAPVDAWHSNPRYMGAAMTAAAVVADANAPVRVSADAPAGNPQSAMIRVSAGESDAPAGLFEACVMSVRWWPYGAPPLRWQGRPPMMGENTRADCVRRRRITLGYFPDDSTQIRRFWRT